MSLEGPHDALCHLFWKGTFEKTAGHLDLQIGVTNYASCKPALWNLLQDQWGNRSRIEDVLYIYMYMIIYVFV
jgi:hypothetical protein